MKTLIVIIIFALLAILYVVFICYAIDVIDLSMSNSQNDTDNGADNDTVPENLCNECLTGVETENKKAWCFNKFCK